MAFNKHEVRKELLKLLSEKFADPLTGLAPQEGKEEEQLSSLLAVYHQHGRVDWGRVNLYGENREPSGRTCREILGEGVIVGCEYPLFAKPKTSEEKSWGARRADLLFVQTAEKLVVLVENKINAKLSTEQLSGYLRYLGQCRFPNRYFIILSGRGFFDRGWYSSELQRIRAAGGVDPSVKTYLVHWEEVFSATIV